MKYIKWLLCLVMMFFILLGIGEYYEIHLYEFPIKSSFSVLLSETEKENFVSFLEQKSDETDVDAYFTATETRNDLYVKEIYYSSENAKNYLIEKCSVTSGEHDFIFMPDITVNYRSLAEYTVNKSDLTVFLHGDMKKQAELLDTVSQEYNVTHNGLISDISFFSSKQFFFQSIEWILAFVLIVAMNIYENAVTKKEKAVRYSMGESPKKMYLHSVLLDTAVFIPSFALLTAVLYPFTFVTFSYKTTLAFFAIFLAINAAAKIPALKIDLRKAFASSIQTNGLLLLSHIFKALCCFLTIAVSMTCFEMLYTSVQVRKQEPFFEKYKDCEFIEMIPSSKTDSSAVASKRAVLGYKLFLECGDDFVTQVAFSEHKGQGGKKRNIIACGRTSKDAVLSAIPEISENELNPNGMTLIIPEYTGVETDIPTYYQLIKSVPSGETGYFFANEYTQESVEILTYSENAYLTALYDKNNGAGKIYKNPVIVLNTFENTVIDEKYFSKEKIDENTYGAGLETSMISELTAFKISDEDFLRFAEENSFDIHTDYLTETNLYGKYQTALDRNSRATLIAAILLAIMPIIDIIFMSVIIKMEYNIHAKEIAVKKVLGYNLFQKNKNIFILSLAIYAVGIAVCVALAFISDSLSVSFALLGCLLQFCTEFPITVFFVVKSDRARVNKILKGGSL